MFGKFDVALVASVGTNFYGGAIANDAQRKLRRGVIVNQYTMQPICATRTIGRPHYFATSSANKSSLSHAAANLRKSLDIIRSPIKQARG